VGHILYQSLVRAPIIPGRLRLNLAEEATLLETLRPDLRRLRDVNGFDVEGQWGITLDPA
jgi:hypothetical protein